MDWWYSPLCWYFRPALWNIAPPTFCRKVLLRVNFFYVPETCQPPPTPSIPPHKTHNTAARRPPHPSYTQQHTTTLQHYTTALGYIKLPMYLLFLWRLYIMDLRAATSLLGALEGMGPENLDFFGHNSTRYACAISGPKKVLIFRAHPFQCHSYWCCTPQNPYVPRHRNSRYINSYYKDI